MKYLCGTVGNLHFSNIYNILFNIQIITFKHILEQPLNFVLWRIQHPPFNLSTPYIPHYPTHYTLKGPVANLAMRVLIVEHIWYFSSIERSIFSYEARLLYHVHNKIVHQPYQPSLWQHWTSNLQRAWSKLYFWKSTTFCQ